MGVNAADHGPAVRADPDALAAIRSLFSPAPGMVYLDSATYGLPPKPTVDALERFIAAWSSGTGDWMTDWDLPSDRCRADFASLIGARPSDVAGIPAASVGTGVVTAALKPGDEIVVPEDEFTSTLFPVLVAGRRGCVVREVPFDRLAHSVSPRTRLVATSLVQMQTGRTADLAAICDAAERVGARVMVDGTQGIPFVDLSSLIGRIDYLVCAAYKHLLCPRGVGFFYVREDHWGELPPHNANWRSADSPFARYFGGPLTLADSAARFDVSRGWMAWFGAIESLRLLVEWRSSGAFDEVRALARALADGFGVEPPGASLVCVPIDDAERIRGELARAGLKAAVRGNGIRFAVHVYNSQADIDMAIRTVEPFVRQRTARA
jgi:selenocysteine lyase/cysteine desulfurase